MNKDLVKEHLPFLFFLACLLVIGIVVADDYGTTTDDPGLQEYADHVIRIYQEGLSGQISLDPGPANLRYYGPAFLTTEKIVEGAVTGIDSHLDRTTLWHFSTFFMFLIGVIAIYSVALNLFDRNIALGVAVLYATQPILWGHAFINGKDIPFLTAFLASIALGIRMENVIPDAQSSNKKINLQNNILADITKTRAGFKRKFGFGLVVLSAFTLFQILISSWPNKLISDFIHFGINNPSSFSGRLFNSWAPNATGLQAGVYIQKATNLAQSTLFLVLVLIWSAFLFFAIFSAPKTRDALKTLILPIPWKKTGTYLKSPVVWAAAITLAISVAIRVLAPFAGALVFIYLLIKKRMQAIPVFLVYVLIAGFGAYLLWPYLWGSPVENFINSIRVMSNFPQDNLQLLNGERYASSGLPFFFLPELLSIQFTIPTLILFIVGAVLLINKRKSFNGKGPLIGILLLWFGLPLAYSLLFRPTTYNNFRQWLFIVPPLFLIGGFGLSALGSWLSNNYRYGLAIVFLIGISAWPIIQLHPYEYIYYNALVGGVKGASGRFELDYWATALTEAAHQLNSIAPEGSRVVVWAANEGAVKEIARKDLLVERNRGGTFDVETGYNYAVISLAHGRDLNTPYPNGRTVIDITRAGTSLAIVKQLDCAGCTQQHENE
jgi:hypothetical protein